MEHDILGDTILARDCGKYGTTLLGVKPQMVDHVAADLVEAGLVPTAPVNPISASPHRHAILADVAHLICRNQSMTVEIREKDTVATDCIKQIVIDSAVCGTVHVHYAALV